MISKKLHRPYEKVRVLTIGLQLVSFQNLTVLKASRFALH